MLNHEIYSHFPFSNISIHLKHTKNSIHHHFLIRMPIQKNPHQPGRPFDRTSLAWSYWLEARWRRPKEFGHWGNFVSCGETVGFLEHVYKKSGWAQFQGCFFFCSLLVFRSELEYDIMEAVVFFFFSWISYFSLESDFFWRWECSWFWNWRVGSSKVSKTLEAKAFCLQSYFITESGRGKTSPGFFVKKHCWEHFCWKTEWLNLCRTINLDLDKLKAKPQ